MLAAYAMLHTDMKFIVLYRPNSEHASEVEAYLHDFEPQIPPGVSLNILSLDTREGADTAALYDIVQYPGMLVTTDDGVPLQIWSGPMLPLKNEVVSYFHG
jgi:hypothetical protein